MHSKKTKGYKTIVNTLYNLSQSSEFKRLIKSIRKKHKLPLNGIVLPKDEDIYAVATQFRFRGYIHNKKTTKEQVKISQSIYKDLENFLNSKGVHYWGFNELLTPFVHLKNVTRKKFLELSDFHDAGYIDVCKISSTKFFSDEIIRFSGEFDQDFEDYPDEKKILEDELKSFPATLLISRTASINQIIDFVRKNKQLIINNQNDGEHKVSESGRVRLARRKYDYIWEHKEVKPRIKLAKMVNKKFRTKHDAIYIRNIISKLKKKRNQ